MSRQKKILAYSIKLVVGIACFWILFARMRSGHFSKEALLVVFSDPVSILFLVLACLLMPLNWGLEAWKWHLVTKPVQPIGFARAYSSVLAGVCAGNLAPGRSTEFIAKILFFEPEHRPVVTLLHFVNGIFQLLITLAAGMAALVLRGASGGQQVGWLLLGAGGLLGIFVLVIARFGWLQQKLFAFRWFRRHKPSQPVVLRRRQVAQLLLVSLFRYLVFAMQFYLLLLCFDLRMATTEAMSGIAVYFMLTSVIPMISIIEPAIRAAIALFVFSGGEAWSFQLVAVSTLLWLINIVLPSIGGYLIILKEKFILTRS